MRILLIRHGKTKGNLERRYVGRTDEALLPEAAQILKESVFREEVPELLFVSPLKRCKETAAILFGERIPETAWKIREDLKETDFGDFEYMNYEELKDDPRYQAWIDGGGVGAFPNGESGVEFRERCVAAFLSCVREAQNAHAETVAFVVHGGTIMSVMECLAQPKEDFYHWQVKNGGGFITESRGLCEETVELSVLRKIEGE